MPLSDSMFLFEIVIKELKSYTRTKKFKIIGQFADIFRVYLKYPTVEPYSKKNRTKHVKQKVKVKMSNFNIKKSKTKIRTHKPSQSILIIRKPYKLLSLMKKHPLEIIINNDFDQHIGSIIIPWTDDYLSFLSKDNRKSKKSVCTESEFNVYDELNKKQTITINMNLKLTNLKDKVKSQIKSISQNPKNNTKITAKSEMINSEFLNDENFKNAPIVSSVERPLLTDKLSFKKINKTQEKYTGFNKSCLVKKLNPVASVKSCSSIDHKQKSKLCRYIFGDPLGSFGNKVYQVGYFTVQTGLSELNSPKPISVEQSPEKSIQSKESKKGLLFQKCRSECFSKDDSCSDNVFTIDLPEELAHKTSIRKCKEVTCDYKKHRELPPPPDDRILLDLTNQKAECCTVEKVEEVVSGVITKMKIGADPCFCTCECGMFSFTKTTYCKICGGYEAIGEDETERTVLEALMPCPIYHNLVDKSKLKTWSSGSESKKKGDDQRSIRSIQRGTDKRSTIADKKSVEFEKGKRKKKDDRFKFNYGYKAPQIGHSKCALPCAGTLDNVPKTMGWLWSAENVPGMQFRPMWKPGAINKHVLRLLRMARHPGQIISKKKRKDLGKNKRPLKRPLLVVHKKDGEYTVTMETMKTFSKPRAINQNPYEDKPLVTYTIGRTEEENLIRQKRKEREQRRLERAQRHFIQSAFKDMCHEICLKTYQQALGILPDAEDPRCTCYPASPSAKYTNMDISCSCSEDELSAIGSDTDSDEWLIEFTPPNATFDPFYKGKKVIKEDNGSQYTYLDYRVKLVDRYGNPVPRYFKGPDGKQECSDLGGFWGPGHNWVEINVDGYIAPDGKWAPMNFIGPSGEQVEAEAGKFQTMTGKWLVVGVDGFVDHQGKWKYYAKAKESLKKIHPLGFGKKGKINEKTEKAPLKSEGSWSCFGDVSPRYLSKLGIVGHGGDRKLLLVKLQKMLAHGEDVRIPQPSTVYRLPPSKAARKRRIKFSSYQERFKCHHSVPSDKGILAVNDRGNKTYFRLKDNKNRRPNQRMATLTKRGISLSSFHVPCFHSFISSEVMKQQLKDKIIALSRKNVATQK